MGKETAPMQNHQQKRNWFARHKVLTVILGFAVLIIIGSAIGGGSSTKGNKATSATKANKQSQIAKIGQAARDGKFEFTVNSVKCGETSVGGDYLKTNAQGQFCRLNLSVKNIGNEAQSLLADNQKLVNAQGQEYSYSSTGTIYAAPSGSTSTWYNDIKPGNSVNGEILFDLPKDQTPITAVLHDSAFSGGVKISLQ